MTRYQEIQTELKRHPKRWLVTGGAGFIGSHVVERLLALGQRVTVLDDLSAGKESNLRFPVSSSDLSVTHRMPYLIRGSICDEATCRHAMEGIDLVVHLAAMGSVPKSMAQPEECHATNVTGSLQIFLAAQKAGVKRVVYASSSAVYGDDPLPNKKEGSIGKCLSPYAASKRMDEIYSQTLYTCFGLESVGFRYFNVFGPRQDPNGAYAAVIPQWIAAMKLRKNVYINGDGENTRDFCFVRDIVQANILGATTQNPAAYGSVFNVGLGQPTSLNQLFSTLQTLVSEGSALPVPPPVYREFRPGDIRHSCADATAVQEALGFAPEYSVLDGLKETVDAY